MTDLHAISFDPELIEGAHNAIRTCLRIKPEEKVTLITDQETAEIGASLVAQLDLVGCRYNAFVLEDYAVRPLSTKPQAVLDDMETSEVSIFAAQAQHGELRTRMQMTDVVNRRHIRHAHMVNITKEIMTHGMRADFNEVDRISQHVWELASAARQIKASTPAGTRLVADMNPNYKWIKTSGIISTLKWGNLPGGETFTTPGEVNGIFVVDGVVGDYLCARYGDLRDSPLVLQIEANRLVSAESANKDLEKEFWEYTHTDDNSDRVGEFAIGTNIGCRDVIGNILQDEKIPGVHIAFGNPYGHHTGAEWHSTTHIDVVGRCFDIWIDDHQIMRAGRFLID
jgi:leucyl aminopeptidase (aminopeptidase T)